MADRDDLGRVTQVIEEAAGAPAETDTYTWVDDGPWLASAAYDWDADGLPDYSAAYTYDCPG